MASRTRPRFDRALRAGRTARPDGTEIGWCSLGDGPGLLIVHGSMQAGLSQLDLAGLLAAGRTVHLLDRRGRGRSGRYPAGGVDPTTEVADVVAAARATGATDLLGISSGAVLALRAALAEADIERVAAFEPPIIVDGAVRLDRLDRFDREYAQGRLEDAMVTAMLVAEMGPGLLRHLPRPVLRVGTRRMLRRDDRRPPTDPSPRLRELATALPADMRIVRENADRAADFARTRASVLLLAGTATRPYLAAAVDALAAAIPQARTVRVPGAEHGVTGNRDQYGRPELVAPVLAEFFGPARPDGRRAGGRQE